ncbi:MAG TPA: S53 family peptidase, partial [Candidatus Methylacidiphilales bacterium]
MYPSFLACGSKRVRAWVWKSQLVAALFVLAGPICSGAVSSGKAILSDSIRELPGVVSGPQDPHRPFISRRALSSSESGALMEFEVALKMRNFPELQQRVGRGELISAQEMAAKYNPLPADEQAVADWLKGLGFTLTRRDSNCLAVFARGTVAQIQSALQVDFARVSLEGTEYTSAITAPTVPATIAPLLVGINGLQPHMRAHKHVLKPMSLNNGGAPYLPSQIAAAYSATGLYTSNITGAGQCIAVVIDTLPAKSDLTSFWSTYGVNQSINNISFITVVSGGTGDLTEATLDTEWASSIAPGAQVRVYATSDLSFGNTDKAYQQIITDVENNVPIHQLSLSYGAGEISPVPISTAQINTDSQLFATLAGKGVSVFAASGDGGSTPDGSGGTTGPKQVQYPASDPSVTGVGGTTLQTGYYNAGQIVETGWSLSGGGLSTLARPNWQTGITGMPGGTQRAVPDVACAADPNYGAVLFVNGQPLRLGYGEGGTSWSTPTWAAFCALINQARASAGLGPIGALNSSLYSVYSGA